MNVVVVYTRQQLHIKTKTVLQDLLNNHKIYWHVKDSKEQLIKRYLYWQTQQVQYLFFLGVLPIYF
jgi:hypothetical protein